MSNRNTKAEIKQLILEGRSNLYIAQQLCITVKTVKFHKTSIFKKEGVSSALQLAAKTISELQQRLKIPASQIGTYGKEKPVYTLPIGNNNKV